MTDQERLQLIIETALNHGYDPGIDDFISWECIGFHATELSVRFEFRGPGVMRSIRQLSITDLLYGDNLSVIKAACGKELLNTESLYNSEEWIAFRWVAAQSVLLPDSERLSFVVEHLRKD